MYPVPAISQKLYDFDYMPNNGGLRHINDVDMRNSISIWFFVFMVSYSWFVEYC